ncbi:MAG: AlpA family phage regulatory protein [Gammaproteobacteria bacterium]|nr:AlpA family phage regulatory protein [Gammaproteobacteria bacterium]
MRVLRKPEVQKRTGLSDPQIWRLENRGEFPRRVRISANLIGWLEHEVDEWLRSRPREGGTRPPPRKRMVSAETKAASS